MNTEINTGPGTGFLSEGGHSRSPRRPWSALVAGIGLLAGALSHGAEPAANAATNAAAEPAASPASTSAPAADGAASGSGSDSSGELSEVVIDASRERLTGRTQDLDQLRDVPISISVVSGADLESEDAFDVGAITKRAADVSWNQGNQRTSSISIRGVGKIGQNEAQDPSVGVTVDDVSYAFNPLTSSINFTDLDQVDVLRGPQGTAGGKNDTLGTINIQVRQPVFDSESNYLLAIGERDTFIGQYAGGGTVIPDLLAFRGTISVDKGQGDIKNIYTTDQTYQNTDRVTGRLQWLLKPAEDFSARLSVNITPTAGEYTNNRTFNTLPPADYANGKTYNSNSNPELILTRSWFTQDPGAFTYQSIYLNGAGQNAVDIDGGYPVETGSYGGNLHLDWKVGNLDLLSISAYEAYHFNARNDEGSPFAVSTTGGVYDNEYSQYSQEFRLTSNIGALADYKTGIYLLRQDTNYSSFSNYLQDAGAYYATMPQYTVLDADGDGRYLMENSLNGLWTDTTQDIRNKSAAAFGQINWHFTQAFNLATGARITYDDRHNSGSNYIFQTGNAAALNPVAVNGVQLGGFSTSSTGVLASTNTPAQVALANSVAQEYFNVATYSALTPAQQLQVADAQALRKTKIGVLWANTVAQPYKQAEPTAFFSPSYKFNEDETGYVSWQHGVKAGISQLVDGVSTLVKPERTDAYEVGLKSALLDRKLILNADAFYLNVHNYQQVTEVYSSYLTQVTNNGELQYASATGNAQWVVSKGFELDAALTAIPYTTVRLSGTYADAYYKVFTNAPQPWEDTNLTTPYHSESGQALPGASRVSGDLGSTVRIPFYNYAFFFGFDTQYESRNNTDTTGALSEYAWVRGSIITDANIGFGTRDGRYNVSVVVKNLTNNDVPLLKTYDTYEPAFARWWGFQVNGKL